MVAAEPLHLPDPPELVEAVRQILMIAHAEGVRVTEDELRAVYADWPPDRLRRAPAEYARDLADMKAMGLDPNDPTLHEDAIPLDDAIDRGVLCTREEWEEIQRERQCGAST